MESTTVEIIGICATIILAFIGYLITYFFDKRIHRRTESLNLINERLENFYGPLYFLSIAGEQSYQALLKKMGKQAVSDNPTQEELEEWRDWTVNIFMPLNRTRKEIIYNYGYLMYEDKIPQSLIDFVTHMAAMEGLISNWEKGNIKENFPIIDYPEGLKDYIHTSYFELKKKQLDLIRI